MAVVFVSHSSKDDATAVALEAWLRDHGITDLFVDHEDIAGGAKWRDELRAAAGACRVVLCLVSANWLASDECFNEFRAAWYMGKRIIPLFLLPPGSILAEQPRNRFAEVCAEDQGIDLFACLKPNQTIDLEVEPKIADRLMVGLRAAGAISRVGLDPEAFAIDRKLRPTPFPGLSSFGDDDADAALLYGRSRELAQALEELRKVRAERDLRPFVILGSSGAGKSSLLKAGIIPRLRHEAPAWLPLRAFRPGADPLLNFAEAIARTLGDFETIEAHGAIRDRLLEAWSRADRLDGELVPAGRSTIETVLEAEGRKLREAAGRPAATILVSVDQAEEMARADGDSGEALVDYLRAALAATATNWQLIFTIRTDSFPELQRHRRFQNLEARGYDLRALPVFRFDSVVEEPAKRYGVQVEQALVDALMEDAPKEDALPLLAFALQRLWRQYAASGALTRDNYDRVGGLKGLIEDAAERALRGFAPEEDVALPAGPPAKRRIDLAASTFVPALAEINDQGATIRRIAAWNSFDEEQQDLLLRFDHWRLVVRKGEADGGTVEVAHEALFREWTRLNTWLEPERGRLDALRSLQVDASAWNRYNRNPVFLNHKDARLAEVIALTGIEGYRKRIGQSELDYIAACEVAERSAQRRIRRVKALVGVLCVCIVASLFGWLEEAYLQERLNWFVTMRPYMKAQIEPFVLAPEMERALKPKDSFSDCPRDCPQMVVVPPGQFVMGSDPTESGHYAQEGPQHMVVISKPFAVSKFEVTFVQWDACVAVGGCPAASDSEFGRDAQPVINVSWDDAKLYVAWLSRMTGKNYRLLSEAEWEYAARAGTLSAFPWGDDAGNGNANCYTCGGRWDNKMPAPVGSFASNAFGLYDMQGNVWEWCEDSWHADYQSAPQDGAAWQGGDTLLRVLRSGSWEYIPRNIRSASRKGVSPVNRSDNFGMRVARTLLPPDTSGR
jgi:formylglycine-generating enzyme required for sulfatase activity